MNRIRVRHSITMFSLLLVIFSLLLSACGDTGSSKSKAGTNQPLTFSFYANYDWWNFSNTWGKDDVSRWIQQNKKVTINFINSNNASKQKLSQMIASDDLPDAMILDRGPDVERLVNANMLVPLDDYINKYPNVKKYIGEKTLNLLRSKDGHIYTIPNWYVGAGGATGQYWITVNTRVYKALGSPSLDTFDELESYLRLVKARYPDMIPADMSAGNFLYPAFAENRSVANLNIYGYPQGNRLVSLYNDPAYLEAMQYTSRLFRDKLITQDLFTQTQDQEKEKANTGKIAVYMGWDGDSIFPGANSALHTTFSDPAYQAIKPVIKAGLNPANVKPGSFSSLGWNVNVITKNAKDPEAIFAYFDWATSPEGQRVLMFGPPGLFWDKTNTQGEPIFNAKYAQADKGALSTYGLGTYNTVGNTNFVDHIKVSSDALLPPDQRSWTTYAQQNVVYKAATDDSQYVNLTPDPTSEIGVIYQRIKDIDTLAIAKMVFAHSDSEVASILKQAQQDMQNAGLDKLLAFETAQWQANLKVINH